MFPITAETDVTLYVKAKNHRVGGYCGLIFAADAEDHPYFIYGALANGSEIYKDFKVIFNGGIESSNSIKSFKWLTDIDTSALEPVSVTETIKSLKSTVGDDLDNTVKSVVDTVKANKEALKSTADELKNLFKF
jgi:hypothetical protein